MTGELCVLDGFPQRLQRLSRHLISVEAMLFGRDSLLELINAIELLPGPGRLFTSSRCCKGLPGLGFSRLGFGNDLLSLIARRLSLFAFHGDVVLSTDSSASTCWQCWSSLCAVARLSTSLALVSWADLAST